MFSFRRLFSNTQDDVNGGLGEEPTDNDRESLLDQVGAPTGPGASVHEVPFRPDLIRSWTMGQGNVKDVNDFQRRFDHPEGIMDWLEEAAVEVGPIQSTDTIVNAAFGHRSILTKESDKTEDADYVTSWTEHLKGRADKTDPSGIAGWNERVTLTAYRVSIDDPAAPLGKGVLTPLLRREQKGLPNDKIWEFKSVSAIIQHKWDLWAAGCLFWESICYFGWLISFVCFLLVYISDDISEDYDTMAPEERGEAFIAYIADAASVIFMSPFLVKAFNAVVYYTWERLQLWSVIDACCYVLQLLISVFHYYHFLFNGNVYATLLAVHCVLLFLRIQYYCRVLEEGAAHVESLKILIAAVRGLLLFIVLTALSAALSFAVLYKWDIHYSAHESNEDLEGFSSFPRAIITTFSVLLGNFEPGYVFDTENKIVKAIFFVIFEAITSIAFLNLMIAVMTQSYSWVLSRGRAVHNRCRAETIDRLEVTIPRCFHREFKPYIDFLVRKDQAPTQSMFSHRGTSEYNDPTAELQKQMNDMKESIDELRRSMKAPVDRTN